jgi:hypothetical protein
MMQHAQKGIQHLILQRRYIYFELCVKLCCSSPSRLHAGVLKLSRKVNKVVQLCSLARLDTNTKYCSILYLILDWDYFLF